MAAFNDTARNLNHMNEKKPAHASRHIASPAQTALNPGALTWDDFMLGVSEENPIVETRASLGRLFQE